MVLALPCICTCARITARPAPRRSPGAPGTRRGSAALPCEVADGVDADAGLGRRAGARREHQLVGLERQCRRASISSLRNHTHLGAEFAEVLHQVEGEAVVVVDHQQHQRFSSCWRRAARKQGQHQRGHATFERLALGLEQRADEEGVAVQFHGAHVALRAVHGGAQRAGGEGFDKARVQAEAAAVAFHETLVAVGLRHAAAGHGRQHLGGFHQFARQRVDDGPCGVGRRLGMVGIGPTQHVARVLDHRMLETAAGAQEGHALLARKADGTQRAVHAGVGAAGHAPHGVEAVERARIQHGVGVQPGGLHLDAGHARSQRQRPGDGAVGGDGVVMVTHQPD
jgi:hypothetical protein